MGKFVVTCSHHRSLQASALLQAAAARGVPPHTVLIVRMLNFQRLKTSIRMIGHQRLFSKVTALMPKLSGGEAPVDVEAAPVRAWMQSENLELTNNLVDICRCHGIRVVFCESLNAPKTVEALAAEGFEFCVYLGGGILRGRFIQAVGGRVFNAHDGPLPSIRGMNAFEWAVYLGRQPSVTLHFIDPGIGTGPICEVRPVELRPGMSLLEGRGECTKLAVQLLLKGIQEHLERRLTTRSQEAGDGKQYFLMHPFLCDIAKKRMASLASGRGS